MNYWKINGQALGRNACVEGPKQLAFLLLEERQQKSSGLGNLGLWRLGVRTGPQYGPGHEAMKKKVEFVRRRQLTSFLDADEIRHAEFQNLSLRDAEARAANTGAVFGNNIP
jgi:hypothetical protein